MPAYLNPLVARLALALLVASILLEVAQMASGGRGGFGVLSLGVRLFVLAVLLRRADLAPTLVPIWSGLMALGGLVSLGRMGAASGVAWSPLLIAEAAFSVFALAAGTYVAVKGRTGLAGASEPR